MRPYYNIHPGFTKAVVTYECRKEVVEYPNSEANPGCLDGWLSWDGMFYGGAICSSDCRRLRDKAAAEVRAELPPVPCGGFDKALARKSHEYRLRRSREG